MSTTGRQEGPNDKQVARIMQLLADAQVEMDELVASGRGKMQAHLRSSRDAMNSQLQDGIGGLLMNSLRVQAQKAAAIDLVRQVADCIISLRSIEALLREVGGFIVDSNDYGQLRVKHGDDEFDLPKQELQSLLQDLCEAARDCIIEEADFSTTY